MIRFISKEKALRVVFRITRTSNCIQNGKRCTSTSTVPQGEEKSTDYVPVYKLPYIIPFSLVNRLKVYQTALTVITVPAAAALNQLHHISSEAVMYTAALGLSGCLTLYGLGFLTQNFVGIMYYNEERDTVKIAYTDTWGRRKDIEIPAKDIVPLNDLPVTMFDGLFFTFRRFSTKDTLKLTLRYGTILDKEKFKRIL
ncbi:hypothetical protein NQ315_001730 [Exocentrus adspersus]|uniref:Transmembrane protein 186 n=1 Tax=Exocentrus adspersus TaxID=1586481 RepID=A0AAV8W982_9CUCU|nr:hypothetical protein NQ315_001730 [Exocentrus adspersus]